MSSKRITRTFSRIVSWPWCEKKEEIRLPKEDWTYLEQRAQNKKLPLSAFYNEIYTDTSPLAPDWSIREYLTDYLGRQRSKDRIEVFGLVPGNDNNAFALWEPAERYFLTRPTEPRQKTTASANHRQSITIHRVIWLFHFIPHPRRLTPQ